MAKQRKTRTKRRVKKTSKLSIVLVVLLILLSIPLGVGIYLYMNGKIVYVQDRPVKKEVKDKDLLAKLESTLREKKLVIAKDLEKKSKEKKPQKPQKKIPTISDAVDGISESQDYEQSLKDGSHKYERKQEPYKGKPKLAIIIDDVSFKHQTKKIKQIPYKVTPSFLPPTKRHPNSAKIAKNFRIYMVHLPLEAKSHKNAEQRTLKVGESYDSMNRWVKKVKFLFPKAKYYNGHTGSKFTEDFSSMDRLFRVLKSKNLKFLDSRTSAKTKANEVAKKYSLKLFSRDVFLDNVRDIKEINKQIKKAVEVAKKHGFAIAICHPYPVTLKALIKAKPLLKDVNLVYVHEL